MGVAVSTDGVVVGVPFELDSVVTGELEVLDGLAEAPLETAEATSSAENPKEPVKSGVNFNIIKVNKIVPTLTLKLFNKMHNL